MAIIGIYGNLTRKRCISLSFANNVGRGAHEGHCDPGFKEVLLFSLFSWLLE